MCTGADPRRDCLLVVNVSIPLSKLLALGSPCSEGDINCPHAIVSVALALHSSADPALMDRPHTLISQLNCQSTDKAWLWLQQKSSLLSQDKEHHGCQSYPPNRIGLALNETNLGLFQFSFQYILAETCYTRHLLTFL